MHDDARGAFESGDAAFGVTMERARFAFTPEDDRLFALGFPNLVVPVDETVDRKKVTTPKQAHRKWDIMEWPAELVMLAIHDPDLILGSHLTKPLAWATKPKAAKAVKPFVASCFTTYRIGERMLYLAEAYWGTRAVADAAVSYLESRTYKQWISSAFETYGSQAVRGLHFVLLRGRKTHRKAWLKRLEAAYAKFADRLQKSGPYGYGTVGDKSSRPFEQLDVTLHGREGVARSGYRCWLRGDEYGQPSFRDLACAIDDPKWVAATVDAHIAESQPNDKGYGEVRCAFLGGPKAVAAMANNHHTFRSDYRKTMARHFGKIRHASIKPMMEAFATKSGVKSVAKAWLADRG